MEWNFDEKSTIKYLINAFPPHIINQINFLRNNFPCSEEGQERLNETIYSYFKYFKFYDIEINKLIKECCLVASIDTTKFIPAFLSSFPQIPLDMENSNFNFPAFFNGPLKSSISTSLPFRYSTFYVINFIITNFFYELVSRYDRMKKEDIEFIFRSLIDILYNANDTKNALQMNLIFVPKLSNIVYFISLSIPDVVFEEAKKYLQKVPVENAYFQFFTLRFFSSFIYPKTVFSDQMASINSIIPPLINYILSNKSVSNLLVAGNEFFRNFLGNVLQMDQTSESTILLKEISKMYGKIQSEQQSFNSTLAMYATMCPQLNLFSIQRFLQTISKQISTKAADVLKTFTVIVSGPNYCPHEICKFTGENFKWRMDDSDSNYLTQMIDAVIINKSHFSSCQSKLAIFFTQLAAAKFAWFIQHHFNRIISDDFFDENGEAVLEFSISLLAPNSPFLKYSTIHENDPIFLQFRNQMHQICIQIFETKSFENGNGNSLTYITNSFTKSLSFNSLENEIENLVEHTTITPLNDLKTFPIDNVLNDWKVIIQGNITFNELLNSIDESMLKTFEQQKMVEYANSRFHGMIIKALNLHFITGQFSSFKNFVLNKIPVFLLSKSLLLSAFTIRLLQAYVHATKSASVLENLLTIQVQQHEEIYIFGLALLNVIEALVYCNIKLDSYLYEYIFAWQCVLISASYIQIRELGFKIAEAVIPISPENSPNIHSFVISHNDEISKKSIEKFISFFTIEKIKKYKIVSFRDVSKTSCYLLYHAFLSTVFLMLSESDCPASYQKILQAHVLTMINERTSSDEFLKNIPDCIFCLNLITIQLTMTTSFDQTMTQNIFKAMLKQAKKILKAINFDVKIYLSFYSSINPQLKYHFRKVKDGLSILIICYLVRFYRKHLDLDTINLHFKNVIDFLNAHDYIRTEIHQINTKMLNDVENSLLPMSLCHMMYTLNKVFKKLVDQFTYPDTSCFLRTMNLKINGTHPFNPNYWFPFLFNIVTMPPLQFPFLTPMAHKVISMYCGFTPVPSKFVSPFIDNCTNANVVDLYTSIIQTSAQYVLQFFASKAIENIVFFKSICRCFREPKDVKTDLKSLLENINNRDKSHDLTSSDKSGDDDQINYIRRQDFDRAIYEHIGSLLANSSFYLCYNNGSEREVSFKLIYHLSLFAIAQGWPGSTDLIPILDNFMDQCLNAAFPIPLSQLFRLHKHLSIVFHQFTEEFIFNSLNIFSARLRVRSFVESAIPWFDSVVITGKYGIVPNSIKTYFTSYSFVNEMFKISFKKKLTLAENFIQIPMPLNATFIIERTTKSNPLFFVDFILFEKISAKPLLLYLTLNYQDVVFPYLLDFLSFDYAFYQKNKESYKYVIKSILSIVNSLLNENKFIIQPKLHTVFLYCFIHIDFDDFKITELIEKIYNLLNVKDEFECIQKFNSTQIKEMANEAFNWMICYEKIEKSSRALQIFEFISIVDDNQIKGIITTIKIVCTLLSKSPKTKRFKLYCSFVSKLLLLLEKVGKPLVDFAADFLICNSKDFNPLFESSLSIVSRHIECFREKFDFIFYRLITADLTPKLVDSVFDLIIKMVVDGFNFDKDVVFLTLIPFIYFNGHHEISMAPSAASTIKSCPRPLSVPSFQSTDQDSTSSAPKPQDLCRTLSGSKAKPNMISSSASQFPNINSQLTKKSILESSSTSNFANFSSLPSKSKSPLENSSDVELSSPLEEDIEANSKPYKKVSLFISSQDENEDEFEDEHREILIKLSEIFGDRVDLIANLPFRNFISNGKFNNIIANLIARIPGEIQYHVVSFFMEILNATKTTDFEDKYFSIIYMISMVYLSMKPNELLISPSVFTSLSERVLTLKSSDDETLRNFIRIYENFKTPILPPKSSVKKSFPLLSEVMLNDESITEKFKSERNSQSVKKFEKRFKSFCEGKEIKISEKQFFPPLKQNSDEIRKRIENLLVLSEKKEINLSKDEVFRIRKISCESFKITSDEINCFFDY